VSIRALIVDDGPAARRILCTFHEGEAAGEVGGTCADGDGFPDASREQLHETIFLEVQIPVLDGLGVLAAALERARAQVPPAQPCNDPPEPTGTAKPLGKRLDRLIIKSSDGFFVLRTDEIDWIEAARNYVCLHVRGKTHLRRDTISNLEEWLDPAKFRRIHRRYMVHIDRIQEFRLLFHRNYRVVLRDHTELPLSRRYREKLQEVFGAGL
jgi:two-component system LytT family response regulator